jgi:glutathione S-transferase
VGATFTLADAAMAPFLMRLSLLEALSGYAMPTGGCVGEGRGQPGGIRAPSSAVCQRAHYSNVNGSTVTV